MPAFQTTHIGSMAMLVLVAVGSTSTAMPIHTGATTSNEARDGEIRTFAPIATKIRDTTDSSTATDNTITQRVASLVTGALRNWLGRATIATRQGTIASGDTSFATGGKTRSSGDTSTTMGIFTVASGIASTATGEESIASGDASFATGGNTLASGDTSITMGTYTVASGIASTAMGGFTSASGLASTAAGVDSTASGDFATAIGADTLASGEISIAMGESTVASGSASTAMGESTVASGRASTAMGTHTDARSIDEVTLGRYTEISSNSNPDRWDATDAILRVGTGTPLHRSDALRVMKSGVTHIKALAADVLEVNGTDVTKSMDRMNMELADIRASVDEVANRALFVSPHMELDKNTKELTEINAQTIQDAVDAVAFLRIKFVQLTDTCTAAFETIARLQPSPEAHAVRIATHRKTNDT